MPALTVDEARARAGVIRSLSYALDFDLTGEGDTFRSTTTARFAATAAETFVGVKPAELLRVTLNGTELDPAALDDGRFPLTGLQPDNELVIEARMAYSVDGEGMVRSVDAADGRVYTYGMSSLESAPRYFACFDQPDLKAPYRMSVTAPEDWVVMGNSAATRVAPRPGRDGEGLQHSQWELAETLPLSTYFVTLVAGPYYQVRSEHDGIPLGLACRQSLAEHLDPDVEELFRITAQCFDEYHRLFGMRYPFGEYWQVFVPDFNLGAMENPGCVTVADHFVYRSAVTTEQRSKRAMIIAHEMAHMWFGDIVTMRWWNDLWLNESFAEYMGHRVSADVTDHAGQWESFAFIRRWWGLQSDQRRSTHPVAPDRPKDARDSLNDFDGISYAKGAAVLKQLAAYLGDDVFLAGVNAHIAAHEFGNAELGELISKLTEAGAEDLPQWADAWLRTSGLDTLTVERTTDGIRINRSGDLDRPHKFTVAGYDVDGTAESVDVLLAAGSESVDVTFGSKAVYVPDATDQTWAKLRLDPESVAALPSVLPRISDGLARAVIWNSVRDATGDAELDPRKALDLLVQTLPAEQSDFAVTSLLRWVDERLLGVCLPYEPEALAQVLREKLNSADAGSSLQLATAHGYISLSGDVGVLRGWLEGQGVPAGLTVDSDLRWSIVLQLVRLGAYGAAEIDAELASDSSTEGVVHAARCRAALPDGKEAAWARIMSDPTVGVSEVRATAEGFWHPLQAEQTAPYVDRFFTDIAGTADLRAGMVLSLTAQRAFPRYAVAESTIARARAALTDPLDPSLHRPIADQLDDLTRAHAIRTQFT